MTIDDKMRKALLHDMHKVFKEKHNNKVRDIDTDADRDAANMSRHPKAKDDLTGEYLSLSYIVRRDMSERTRRRYTAHCQQEHLDSKLPTPELHMQFLHDTVVGCFNEITSMPYTSLKYHTLLVCALHYNYKQGLDMQELYLHCVAKQPKEQYTAIFNHGNLWFVINNDATGAKIGAAAPFFGQTIGRLYNVPLPEFLVDNLRRFRSWSAGLQYLEDALTFMKESEVT